MSLLCPLFITHQHKSQGNSLRRHTHKLMRCSHSNSVCSYQLSPTGWHLPRTSIHWQQKSGSRPTEMGRRPNGAGPFDSRCKACRPYMQPPHIPHTHTRMHTCKNGYGDVWQVGLLMLLMALSTLDEYDPVPACLLLMAAAASRITSCLMPSMRSGSASPLRSDGCSYPTVYLCASAPGSTWSVTPARSARDAHSAESEPMSRMAAVLSMLPSRQPRERALWHALGITENTACVFVPSAKHRGPHTAPDRPPPQARVLLTQAWRPEV